MKKINHIKHKIKRLTTCLKPISQHRKGDCINCGACCKLPVRCIFLSTKNTCIIYKIRPPNCRKYPRCSCEHVTHKSCGYYFERRKEK
jgi:Fe-S-cluster containining protein